MTVNANYKTQVQARIDAVTGATPLSDLIKLQTAARGLACNIAPLAAQINARLSAAGGATPLTDLAMMGILAEGSSRYAYYTVPFVVDKGDRLFIDAFGAVTKEMSPATAAAGNLFSINAGSSELAMFASIPQRSVRSYSGDFLKATPGAVLQLANGNWMLVRSYRLSNGSNGSVVVQVLNPDCSAVLGQIVYDVSSAMSVSNMLIVGAYEVSANTFRVYFLHGLGTSFYKAASFFTLAYNPTTHVVSASAGAAVFTASADASYTAQHSHRQGDRYILLRASDTSTDIRRLDMLNASAPSLSVSAGAQFDLPDHSATTNVWTRLVAGGTVTLLRLDGTDNISLPANLTADGCFGSSFAVRHIGQRRWLCASGSVLKLVVFNAAYTTCSIFSLDAAFGATGSISIDAVIADGDRFYVGIQAALPVMISFVFNGVSAPTEYQKLGVPTLQVRQILDALRRSANVNSTDRVICSVGVPNTAGDQGWLVSLSVRASVYTGLRCRHFATCLTSAAAGQAAEVELSSGTEPAISTASTATVKRHQFLETKLLAEPHRASNSVIADTGSAPVVPVQSSLLQLNPLTRYGFRNVSGPTQMSHFVTPWYLYADTIASNGSLFFVSTEASCVFTGQTQALISEEPLA